MRNLVLQIVRFAGIGFLNAAVDFTVLNLLANFFGIYQGATLGFLNAISFTFAVIHSFFWNKYWAFGTGDDQGIARNMGKVIMAGGFGVGILLLVGVGAKQEYGAAFYVLLLGGLIAGELILWKLFRIAVAGVQVSERGREFVFFIIVSVIGALINSGVVVGITNYLNPLFGLNQELWLNFAKVAATCISLVWNFIGYKLVVFRR